MDFDTRLKTLARLAESKTDAAERALRREFDTASAALSAADGYDVLEQSLDILGTIGFRFSSATTDALTAFVQSIDARRLTYSERDQLLGPAIERYRNSSTLIEKAIEVLRLIRYLEMRKTFHNLVRLSIHPTSSVSKKAIEALGDLSGYNIRVFQGDDQQDGIGAAPQTVLLEECRKFSNSDIVTYFQALLAVLDSVLSPSMEDTAWSSKSVTLSRAATPATRNVGEARLQSIELLIRVYGVVQDVDQKLRVIGSLVGATRTERGALRSDDATGMFVRDALRVLTFFVELVPVENLQIVQDIEHHSYWIFYHGITKDVKVAALKVRDKIAERAEYSIYRGLIGFEGIFGDWETLDDEKQVNSDEFRKKAAREYVEQINEGNYAEWRQRIVEYAKTKSVDMATFPIFYYFLERLAATRPALAFRLLSEDTEALSRFLIPLLRGLWSSAHRDQARNLIERWVGEGRYLYVSMKQFLSNADLDLPLAKRLLAKAAECGDQDTIQEAISVAVSNYGDGRGDLIAELMLPAIELLTRAGTSRWVFDNWFRREMKDVLAVLDPASVDIVLENLAHLQKIDYHAEEILAIIAGREPEKVLTYLCERLRRDERGGVLGTDSFERIPFDLHKLDKPLSKVPELVVRSLRQLYKGDYSDFVDGGARLIAKIFPSFSNELEAALLDILRQGGDENLKFVAAILRNYHGEQFVHRLAKEIVKASPGDTPLRTEVAVALEHTGMVSGEFGMSDAYERKRQEVLNWLDDPDQRVQGFAKWYISGLEQMRDAERKRAEEDIALRKFRFGEE